MKNRRRSRELHFRSHKTIANFLDAVLDNLNTRFPQGSKNIISAFGILNMRPLSFVPTNEVSVWGDEELDVLLTQFAKEEAAGPALVNEQAVRYEWSVLKPLVLKQKYARDRMEDLWGIINHYHPDMFPSLLKLASIALTLPVQILTVNEDLVYRIL